MFTHLSKKAVKVPRRVILFPESLADQPVTQRPVEFPVTGAVPPPAQAHGGSNMLTYYCAALLKNIRHSYNDDFSDQLNHFYTASLLVTFAFLVSAKQYVGQPIQCWVPATFTTPMEQYTENYCWVQSTYWVRMHEQIPIYHTDRDQQKLSYYQWVPFILGVQALMYYLPCLLWRGILYWKSHTNLESMVRMAADAADADLDTRMRIIRTICAHLEDRYRLRYGTPGIKLSEILSCPCAVTFRKCGSSLAIGYLAVKIIYCLNTILQFTVLGRFLGSQDIMYGYYILADLYYGHTWESSGIFPRVTLCDFEVRVLGNLHRHTVQCVLMINMFHEKIFMFLWFWLLLIAAISACSMLHWFVMLFCPGQKIEFVRRNLLLLPDPHEKFTSDNTVFVDFVNKYLSSDGVFMLRMISNHAGELVAADILTSMWSSYSKIRRGNLNFFFNDGAADSDHTHA